MSLKYEPSSEPLHTCQCVQNTRRGVQHDADNADPNRCKMVWATSLGTRSCPSRRPSSSTGCLQPCLSAAARCVFKAHGRFHHSTLGLGVIMKKKKVSVATVPLGGSTVHPHTIHPTPHTIHPTPHTLHPTPCTLHPTPYTLHPTPCTLHPAPYTLHPTP